MSLPVEIHADAQAEFDEAVDWFQGLRSGSGVAFARAVKQTLDRIAAQPRMHAVVSDDYRRAPVTGYPYYRVFYRELADRVRIVSVFHTSRDPSVWQGRV
ncbi:type II toxin-antitoxin system RelE/ParE family toxin [Urbifossiella limnaea]|uniref:Plasmid stabilization system protein n=1 Tax=Urbifossiella limnaea TaxID=2528023 RepID=A0A517XYY6_9BACT|nr:type II toxin-antitoxin system RelE/ParE family toxin [Urbifossiella limnaea]QDU22724.1 Plasmid stabilization system protein [Urbifossiella limnaea]